MRYESTGRDAEDALRVSSHLADAGFHPEPCAASPPKPSKLCLFRDFDFPLFVRVEFDLTNNIRDTDVAVVAERGCTDRYPILRGVSRPSPGRRCPS
jgi:hypothetical protein